MNAPAVDRKRLARPAVDLAPRLLGAVIRSRVDGAEIAVRITEVEAYAGASDPASHAYRGHTRRNEVMFGPAGHLYCYFTYGLHWCANVVCGPAGVAAAVLLRAGEVVAGGPIAHERRPSARSAAELARGPARLAACLGLGAGLNGVDLCDPAGPVALEGMPVRRLRGIASGPRVGISVAQAQPWRFWLDGDPTVSAFRSGGRRRASAAPTGGDGPARAGRATTRQTGPRD